MPTVPPFVSQIVGTLVRAAIVWLAATFGAEVSDDQIVKITAQVVPVLFVIVWSIYQKFKNRQTLVTALASPKPMSEDAAKALVKDPAVPTPSVNSDPKELPA